MTGTAAHDRYADPVWGSGPGRAGPPWSGGPNWGLPFAARPLWIAITILSFIVWWPIGLAVLFFLIGSKRMACNRHWRRSGGGETPGWAPPWSAWKGFCGGRHTASSGNRAFDEYRADTLRRLEDEQSEFASFLERLRQARDKAEFDAFMTERRQPPQAPAEPAPG